MKDANEFRSTIRDHLANKQFIIANFKLLKDEGGLGYGHISPIGAYSEKDDMFLVLEVRKSWDPFWIKSDLLYTAMLRKDTSTKTSRGYIVIDS